MPMPLGPYGGPREGGHFLMSEIPLYVRCARLRSTNRANVRRAHLRQMLYAIGCEAGRTPSPRTQSSKLLPLEPFSTRRARPEPSPHIKCPKGTARILEGLVTCCQRATGFFFGESGCGWRMLGALATEGCSHFRRQRLRPNNQRPSRQHPRDAGVPRS
jgi:hypothetical protein